MITSRNNIYIIVDRTPLISHRGLHEQARVKNKKSDNKIRTSLSFSIENMELWKIEDLPQSHISNTGTVAGIK